ncbi:MAG: hypothetical protein QOC73_2334 [Actinomycetota bacterium]|nr:hypothetical protein [Actinomycetota bacterium]
MDNDAQARAELAVRRVATQSGCRAQSFDAGRHIGDGVRVQGARTAVLADVESGQQVDTLGAAYFADDKSVGTHPQRLTNQRPQIDGAGALDVRRSRLEPDEMRMVWPQLAGVFDKDDPLVRINATEQRGQQRRLPRAGASCDDERDPRRNNAGENVGGRARHRPEVDELVQRERTTAWNPKRQTHTRRRNRRQNRMQPDAVGEPYIRAGNRVVKSTTGGRSKPNCEAPDVTLVAEPHVGGLETAAAIDPDLIGRVDEDVGNPGLAKQDLERARAEQLTAQRLDCRQHLSRTANADLLSDECRHPRTGRGDAFVREPVADPLDQRGIGAHHGHP